MSTVATNDPDGSLGNLEQWGDPPTLPGRRKTGGRQKGSKNKRTLERAKILAAIKASGKDPVSFFFDLLRNEDAPLDLRFAAAKELAPYVHPKLASIESRTGGKTHEQRLAELQAMTDDDDQGEGE